MAKEGSSGTEGVLLRQQDDEHDVFLSNSRAHHLCLWCYVVLCLRSYATTFLSDAEEDAFPAVMISDDQLIFHADFKASGEFAAVMTKFRIKVKREDDTFLILNEWLTLTELDVRRVKDAESSFDGDDFENVERCWVIHRTTLYACLRMNQLLFDWCESFQKEKPNFLSWASPSLPFPFRFGQSLDTFVGVGLCFHCNAATSRQSVDEAKIAEGGVSKPSHVWKHA